MLDLPTGTVTFLFTDIEGSTELVASMGEAYPQLLDRHNELLREAFARHGGVEVATEGDAFFVVFTSPAAAVRAAVDGQRALAAESWPDAREVRVRMGLHTGEGLLGSDNYVGLDVHRASRVASAGHGGQILISDATRGLVEPSLPDGASVLDLGLHRLKGLPSPERIFQVSVAGLASSFPPLGSLEIRPNNLPLDLTSFIGRERQIEEVSTRLSDTRLLTLTGPGGTGKTRLAIRVAEDVLDSYEHGCWFVSLASLRDPDLVPSAIATALGVKVAADRPPAETLASWLTDRQLLLVLDNFEQVAGAAPTVAGLLSSAPRLQILATSRAPLHLYGEQEYPVPPLATRPEGASPTVEFLGQYEAVQLFIERAVAVKPDFRVTNANAPAVAEICSRLDGLPLAIELAAARVKLLSPEQMLGRLQHSLALLANSAQNLPERQRTLLGAIDWSHQLLSSGERRLFARLSIFRGGFSLEAAEDVCGADGLELDMFDGIASLVDKSLLRSEEMAGETRFSMLETIREYARERLTEAGALQPSARRHAAHYFALATDAEAGLEGPDQLAWLDRLEREHDNLRAAYGRQPETGMVDQASVAAGSMWRFWQLRGHFAEARSIFDRLLSEPDVGPAARAKALIGAGGIAYWQGDYEPMARCYQEARALYESVGDLGGMAEATFNESYVPLLARGDFAATRTLAEQARDLYRRSGNPLGEANAESVIAFTYMFAGDPAKAIGHQARLVDTLRANNAYWRLGDNLMGLSTMYAQLGDWPRALELARESMDLAERLGVEVGLGMAFASVGGAAVVVGDLERAGLLLGKADEIKDRLGAAAPSRFAQLEGLHDRAREELGPERYQQLHARGAAMSLADARRLVDEFSPPPDAPPAPRHRPWGEMATERETSDTRGPE